MLGLTPFEEHQAKRRANSFGDAAAAITDPTVQKVTSPSSAPLPTWESPEAVRQQLQRWGATGKAQPPGDPVMTSVRTDTAPATSQPGDAAVGEPLATAKNTGLTSNAIKFDPRTNTYSGTNIGPGATIAGGLKRGMFSSGGIDSGAASAQRVADIYKSAAANLNGADGVAAPTILHSGNSWQARNDLRSAAISASSMTNARDRNPRTGMSPAEMQLAGLVSADATARGAQPGLDQEAMRQAGENQRAGLAAFSASAKLGLDARRLADEQQTSALERQKLGFGLRALADQEQLRSVMSDANAPAAQRTQATSAYLATMGKGSNIDAPSGYAWSAPGRLQAIPGGPADPAAAPAKPLNDTQAKALQFGARMQSSGEILDRLAAAGTTQPGKIKQAADVVGLGPLANWTQSPEQQQVEQAQRDYVNAVLRRESGAAISSGEFNSARQQYFPQIGDSPQVTEQKRKNRELATAGLLAEVPGNDRVAQVRAEAATQPANPALDELRRRAQNDPQLAERLRASGY